MIPAKPFPTYKWRWLSVTPSESLLQAPIFLGVLRALARHENEPFSSAGLRNDLLKVQLATNSSVTLARDRDRNLFRNSGQYWRGTGLLSPESGSIHLTGLGARVASGQITQGEFAALIVQQTILPNPLTYSPSEIAKWNAAGLEIRPLRLILQVLEALWREHGGRRASHLTNRELFAIVIPLAGAKAGASEIASDLAKHRRGALDISGWPDCAPGANDPRLTNEFLLFLANFGLLRHERELTNLRDDQRYYLEEVFNADELTAAGDGSIFTEEADASQAVQDARHSALPSLIERQRVMREVLTRPGQARFRARVLAASQGCCALTGESIPEALEAAHIIPVNKNGSDEENNGLCLRIDLHRLFDAGHLRIRPGGALVRSEMLAASNGYAGLPAALAIPAFVNPANIAWRFDYL